MPSFDCAIIVSVVDAVDEGDAFEQARAVAADSDISMWTINNIETSEE